LGASNFVPDVRHFECPQNFETKGNAVQINRRRF